jgi:hypothetical protein
MIKRLLLALPCVLLAASPVSAQMMGKSGNPEVVPPYTADPGPRAKDWEVTFGVGGISSLKNFDNTAVSAFGSVGYYYTKNIPISLRQTIAYGSTHDDGDDSFAGSTLLFVDYQFDFGKWQPLIGFGLGGNYGNGVDGGGLYALEVGVKYFVNESTFIYALPNYGASMNQGFSRGAFNWNAGIGVTF